MFRAVEFNLRKKSGLIEEDEDGNEEIEISSQGRVRKMTVLVKPVGVQSFDKQDTKVNSFGDYIMDEYIGEFQAYLATTKTNPEVKNIIREDKKWLKLLKQGGMEETFKATLCEQHFQKIFKDNTYPVKTFLKKFVRYIRGIIRYMCDLLFAKVDKFLKDYYEIPDKIIDAIVKAYNDNFLRLEKYQFPLGEMKRMISEYISKQNGRDVIRLLKSHHCTDDDQLNILRIREVFVLRRLPLLDPNIALPYTISPYESAIKILGGLGKSFNMDVFNLMGILEKAYNSIFEDIDKNMGETAEVNDTDLSLVIAYCLINSDVHKIAVWLEYVRAHIPKIMKKEEEEKKLIALLFCFVMKWVMDEIVVSVEERTVEEEKFEEYVPRMSQSGPISLLSRRIVKKTTTSSSSPSPTNTTNNKSKIQQQPKEKESKPTVIKLGSTMVRPVRPAPGNPSSASTVVKIGGQVVKPTRRAPLKPPKVETKPNEQTVVKLGSQGVRPARRAPMKPPVVEPVKKTEVVVEKKKKKPEVIAKKEFLSKPSPPKETTPVTSNTLSNQNDVFDEFLEEEELLEEEDLEEEVSVSIPEESTEVISTTEPTVKEKGKTSPTPQKPERPKRPNSGKGKQEAPGRPPGRPSRKSSELKVTEAPPSSKNVESESEKKTSSTPPSPVTSTLKRPPKRPGRPGTRPVSGRLVGGINTKRPPNRPSPLKGDGNSSTPSPISKKPYLADENVEEKKNGPPPPSRPPKPGVRPPVARNINPSDRTKRLNQVRRRSVIHKQKLASKTRADSVISGDAVKPPMKPMTSKPSKPGGTKPPTKPVSKPLKPVSKPKPKSISKPGVPKPISKPGGPKPVKPSKPIKPVSKPVKPTKPSSRPVVVKKRGSGTRSPIGLFEEEKKELISTLIALKGSILNGDGEMKFEYNGPKSQVADLCKEIIVDILGKKLKEK